MRFCKLPLLLLSSTLCLAAQPDRIASPIDSSQMVTLPGRIHPRALPQFDQGPVEPTLPFSYVTLVIAPSTSQQKALDQLLAQQQDRSSPNFHKWLTPEEYAGRFGLSAHDVGKITLWLKSQGFTLVDVARGRNSIVFSGLAAQVQNAFGTEIHRYEVNGEKHIANSTPVQIPAALKGVVTGVRGLTDFRPKPMYVRPRGNSKTGPHPKYTTKISGNTDYFLAPGDIATLYDLNPFYNASTPINGANQKIAIVGQTDVYLADLVDFRSGFSLPSFTCSTGTTGLITGCNTTYFRYILVGADEPVSVGDLFESDLDLEWAGATAPNTQIIFVNAPVNSTETSGGVDIALAYAINNNVAPIVSMSYGLCEAENESLETELQQANTQGMTILNSAGDTGSFACDDTPPGTTSTFSPNPPFAAAQGGLGVNYPASSPEVTGIGGTSIPAADLSSTFWSPSNGTTGGSALSALIGQEAGWNDNEALAQFCQASPTTTFCENGGPPAVTGWVPLTSTATPAQVQEDIWISSGGGGVSNCFSETSSICTAGFAQPTWQQAIRIPGLTSPQSTYRFVPDLSLAASPDFPGYIVCTPQEEVVASSTSTTSTCSPGGVAGISTAVDTYLSLVGGTSASTPIFAGMVALLSQFLGTSGLGNINSTLYALAASPANGAFHPVKTGDNNVYCQKGTPAGQPADVICPSAGVAGFSAASADATTGYNLVTGLGSVDANALALAWAASLKPDFQLTAGSLTPATVAAGGSASATLTIQPITGSVPMVVNFSPSSCTGLPTGASCSFNPPSINFDGVDAVSTTVTISTVANMALPAAAQTVTITPTNSKTVTAAVVLTVTKTTESFTLSSTATTFPISVGGTAKVDVTVNSATGFVNTSSSTTVLPLAYSCSGIPTTAEISCQVSNNGQPSNATTVTVSLVTTPVTTQVLPSPLGRSRIFYALLLPGLFGVVWARPRWRGLRMFGLIAALAFSTLWLGACGGSKNTNSSLQNTGTPAGNYSITISGTTGGASPIANNVTVILAVSAQ